MRSLIRRIDAKDDRFGFEMDDDARVWRVYAKAAQKRDNERLAQWNNSLDTLLIFVSDRKKTSAPTLISCRLVSSPP